MRCVKDFKGHFESLGDRSKIAPDGDIGRVSPLSMSSDVKGLGYEVVVHSFCGFVIEPQ